MRIVHIWTISQNWFRSFFIYGCVEHCLQNVYSTLRSSSRSSFPKWRWHGETHIGSEMPVVSGEFQAFGVHIHFSETHSQQFVLNVGLLDSGTETCRMRPAKFYKTCVILWLCVLKPHWHQKFLWICKGNHSRMQFIPSGKHTKNYGKSPYLMGKSTINGHFQ